MPGLKPRAHSVFLIKSRSQKRGGEREKETEGERKRLREREKETEG